jgi:hypothetical protein
MRGVVLGVKGAGLEGVELCVKPRPAKELVYVFDRRPYTSRSTLQAYSKMWLYQNNPYNQVYPEFPCSNHHKNVP